MAADAGSKAGKTGQDEKSADAGRRAGQAERFRMMSQLTGGEAGQTEMLELRSSKRETR